MKSRRILAAVLTPTVAMSALTMVAAADAVKINGDVGLPDAVSLNYDETYDSYTWSLNLFADGVLEGVDIADIYGVQVEFTEAIIEDSANTGVGGAIAFSSQSAGWDSAEWGNEGADKTVTLDASTHSITRLEDTPRFSEDDVWASINLQISWGPEAEVQSLSLLGEDGTVLKTFPVEEEEEEKKDTEDEENSEGEDENEGNENPADPDDEKTEGEGENAGTTDKAPVVIEADVKGVDSENGIEGDALVEKILIKDGKKYGWDEVASVTFTADKPFSVQFAADKDKAGTDWFTMGVDGEEPSTVAAAEGIRAEDDAKWATEWTLDEDEFALFDMENANVKLIAKEGTVDINVSVTLKADAAGTDVEEDNGNGSNADTGIALAIAPVILAGVGAAVVIGKKRK